MVNLAPDSRALRAARDDGERVGPAMRCPSCGSLDTQVKDSRPTEDSAVIRRRRVCLTCNFRFTTFERVQLRELTVIKRNGRRVPFDRDKLMRSVQIALRKRPVEPERIERMVSKIVRELESQGESEISSEAIGEIVMEHLRDLDDVAYVRFASVYRNFREAKDFRAALDELSGDDNGRPAASARKGTKRLLPLLTFPPTSASCGSRLRSGAAISAVPGPIRQSVRLSLRTAQLSLAAGRNRVAARMLKRKRCAAPRKQRKAPPCMWHSNPVRTTGKRHRAP